MKYLLLIALQISAFAFIKTEPIEYKDEPIVKNFVDSEWRCTKEQLDKAREKFSKCYDTPVERDCYMHEIKANCTRKLF